MQKEIRYRLAKWLVGDMVHKSMIGVDASKELVQQLQELYDPPFKCLDTLSDDIGDGFNIADKDDWGARKIYRKKLYCEECGYAYGPKPIHSTDKYRKIVWVCGKRWNNGKTCNNRVIIHDKELVKALHQCGRELIIRYRIDRDISKILRGFKMNRYSVLQRWMREWKAKDIKWCISDEHDLMLILDVVLVKVDGSLLFLFQDSSEVEYQLQESIRCMGRNIYKMR